MFEVLNSCVAHLTSDNEVTSHPPEADTTRLILHRARLFSSMNNRWIFFTPILVSIIVLFTACASNKPNWDTRVGNYTYDQAVTELGPPNKMAMLSDQSKVAEWYTGRSRGVSLGVGTGVGPVGVGMGVPVGGNRIRSLRLTFGPDGNLKSWSR